MSVLMMPLNLNMGHVENWSQKLVLDVLEATTEAVPTPRAGRATAAPTGPEAATAATAELAAAATRAAPEKTELRIRKIFVINYLYSFINYFHLEKSIQQTIDESKISAF